MVDLSGAVWKKATRSMNQGACVEVAFVADAVAARDSKAPAGPALVFDRARWTAFVARLHA